MNIDRIETLINTFDNTSNIRFASYLEYDKHYVITIYGGLNGCGNWKDYTEDINTLIRLLDDSWIISLENDVLDDIWTLKIGIYK